MNFLEQLKEFWSIILFIGGGIFTFGYAKATAENTKRKVNELDKRINEIEKSMEAHSANFADLKGDIKEIKAMINLLVNDKIK